MILNRGLSVHFSLSPVPYFLSSAASLFYIGHIGNFVSRRSGSFRSHFLLVFRRRSLCLCFLRLGISDQCFSMTEVGFARIRHSQQDKRQEKLPERDNKVVRHLLGFLFGFGWLVSQLWQVKGTVLCVGFFCGAARTQQQEKESETFFGESFLNSYLPSVQSAGLPAVPLAYNIQRCCHPSFSESSPTILEYLPPLSCDRAPAPYMLPPQRYHSVWVTAVTDALVRKKRTLSKIPVTIGDITNPQNWAYSSNMLTTMNLYLIAGALVVGCHAFLPQSTIRLTRPSCTTRHLNNFFNFNKEDEKEVVETKEEEEFQDGAYDAEDPVEQIFSFFFGKREEKPMGMGKMDAPNGFPVGMTPTSFFVVVLCNRLFCTPCTRPSSFRSR